MQIIDLEISVIFYHMFVGWPDLLSDGHSPFLTRYSETMRETVGWLMS